MCIYIIYNIYIYVYIYIYIYIIHYIQCYYDNNNIILILFTCILNYQIITPYDKSIYANYN